MKTPQYKRYKADRGPFLTAVLFSKFLNGESYMADADSSVTDTLDNELSGEVLSDDNDVEDSSDNKDEEQQNENKEEK